MQKISLAGFDYYNTVELAKTQLDSLGHFSLSYPKEYTGMALLKSQDNSRLVVLLGGENISLQGTHLNDIDNLVLNEAQNKTFFTYAMAHANRKNALNAWVYLDELYGKYTSFATQETQRKVIAEEIQRLNDQEQTQIRSLVKESFLRWFIPYYTFIQDMPDIIRAETERIPESISLFRTTDFNNTYWKTSGILQEFIEKHYLLLENLSGTVEDKQEKMNKSSLYLIQNLKTNETLTNQVVEKLFTYLEQRQLFIAAEFLATQVLNGAQCEIQENTANKLEKYRALKVGVKAPDIQLSSSQKLSDFDLPLLLVFGKSDCPYCKEGIQELSKHYATWKTEKGVEVVYISLDTDKKLFAQAYQNIPWLVFCEFKGWDAQVAKDYHIWGTPSYFLVDKDLTILAHINTVAHANAWIMQRL